MKALATIFLFAAILGVCIYSFNSNKNVNTHDCFGDSTPSDREDYMRIRREGSYDMDAITVAKRKIKNQLDNMDADVRDGGINGWDPLGPYNIGGRTRAIAIDPNDADHIFIGVAGGGIWSTTDAGDSWSLMTPFLDSYPVMDIQYHPSNSNIMFAVTGEYRGSGNYPGVGVLKSVDGGANWNQMNHPSTGVFRYLSKVRFHPADSNIMYVAGSKRLPDFTNDIGVLYKSINGGVDWTEIYTEVDVSGNIYDLEIIPVAPYPIYYGSEKSAFISKDGGLIFEEVEYDPPLSAGYISQRCEVEFCKSDPTQVFIQRYAIEDATSNTDYQTILYRKFGYSPDFDELTMTSSNSQENILGSQGNYDNVLWVNPTTCNTVLMGGIELWKFIIGASGPVRISDSDDDIGSNDAGEGNSIHADQHVIVEHPDFNSGTNSQIFIGNDGGIYKNNNINVAQENTGWESLTRDLNITQFFGGDASYDGVTLVGGSQDNHYTFDVNSDDNQGEWDIYARGDGGFCKIDKKNPSTFYTTTQRGNLFKTIDAGESFCHIFSFSSGNPFSCCNCGPITSELEETLFIAPFTMDPSDSERLFFGGRNLYESTDGGDTWNDIIGLTAQGFTVRVSAIDISKSDKDVIWIGVNASDVFFTNVGGGAYSDWTRKGNSNSILPNLIVTDISIHPLDPKKVMITFGGYNQTHIFITEDGGNTFENRSLNFDMQVNSVRWHPELLDMVYVGTDVGIFASEDSGMTWSAMPYYSEGEGPVYVGVEELFWQGDGSASNLYYLMAATHGRGMWRTSEPIRSKYYVNKNCFFCGESNVGAPFQFFKNAVAEANKGATITFLSTGSHDEVPPALILEKKLNIISQNGSAILD